MKRLLNTTSILAVATFFAIGCEGTGGAYAADIYKGGSTKDAPVAGTSVSDSVNWSGVYFGAHAGYGWGTYDATRNAGHDVGAFSLSDCSLKKATSGYDHKFGLSETDCNALKGADALQTPGSYSKPNGSPIGTTAGRIDEPLGSESFHGTESKDAEGLFGGLDLSYKFQMNRFILEPFVDASLGGGRASFNGDRDIKSYDDPAGVSHDISAVGLGEEGTLSIRKRWGATVGGKAGFLIDDRDYVYGLAGLAYGKFDIKGGAALTGGGPFAADVAAFPASKYSDDNAWGYTVGAGWERAVTDHVHLGLEGRWTAFSDIGSDSSQTIDYTKGHCAGGPSVGCTLSTHDSISADYGEWSVLGRISYKIGN